MFRNRCFFLSLIIAVTAACPAMAAESACEGCHRDEVNAWRNSHHAAAMSAASADTVLAKPAVAVTDRAGTSFELKRDGANYAVQITETDGASHRYPLRYTFGVVPLQQYLVDIGDGRLQALPVAFDTRPANDGGQRWFALDTDLHWRSFGFNWNTSCADCHSTDLRRNYDPEENRFHTVWSEINVACGACHRGIDGHRKWVQMGRTDDRPHAGFDAALPRRGSWRFNADQPIAVPAADTAGDQLPMCARCHAHRTLLDDNPTEPELLNQMTLSLLEPGLYHSDGQIDAEVYVTGSFLQSKMHAAGVVCSDCHEPHSLQLRAEGNGVCLQCHRADHFARREHHGHTDGGSGGQCVACHMPATTYMVVDPRRDHRFGIPDPGLTRKFGIPNACADCHADRDEQWLQKWFGKLFPAHRPDRYAHIIAAFDAGSHHQLPHLQALAKDNDLAPIKRASALLRLGPRDPALPSHLNSVQPILRYGALRSLQGQPLHGLMDHLWPRLQDPVLAVRLEATRLLEPLLGEGTERLALTIAQREQLTAAVASRRAHLRRFADHPANQMNLAISYEYEGRVDDAERAYSQALRIEPDYVPALLNLAELQRHGKNHETSADLLARAVTVAPDSPDAHFALGLHQIRQRDYSAALASLGRAAQLAPDNLRFVYTLAVAQEQTGDINAAIATLRRALGRAADEPLLLRLITQYALRAGRTEQARAYLERWRAVTPRDPAIPAVERALQQHR